jgi:TolA-binding protein
MLFKNSAYLWIGCKIKSVCIALIFMVLIEPFLPAGFLSAAEDDIIKTRNKMLADIGMKLESARIKPAAVRTAEMEGIAQSVQIFMREDITAGQKSAAYFLWGEIQYSLGDFASAAEQYRKSAKSYSKKEYVDDASFAYISALEAAGRDKEATKEWIKWEKKHGTSPLLPEAMLARTWIALRCDTLKLASSLIEDLRTRFPNMIDDPRLTLAAATLAYLEDRPSEALEVLKNVNSNSSQHGGRGSNALSMNIVAPVTYLRALCLEANGEMLQAAANFQEIVDRHPESVLRDNAMIAKANIFLASKAYKSATEEYSRVIQHASQAEMRAEAELRRAASVILDGNEARGTELLRETIARYPKTIVGARAQYMLGEVLMSQSKHEDAILEFNRVLTDYFEHSLAASAQYRVGRCLDALDRQVEATSSYQAVVSGYPLSPESPAAAYLAGAGLLAQDLPIAAAPYFQLVLDRYASSNDTGTIVFTSPEHQELVEASLCLLELSFHRTGNLGQLSGIPHLMLQKMPPSKSSWRAYALLIDADALASQARYAEAQEILKQLIREFQEHRMGISANRLLAWTYAQEGNDELAMETEALMLSKYASYGDAEDMSSAHLNKAHILFNQKKYKEAASTYEGFLQRFPSHQQKQLVCYQAGLSYLRLGRTGNAVDKWEEAIASDSSSEIAERAWARAGDLYFQNGHYEDAKRCYQGLLDHFSDSHVASMAMLRLAQCDYNAGNDRNALEHFSDVEARFPGSHVAGVAKKGIEQALFRLGQREDGSEVLAELVENYPTSSFAADAQFEIAMRHYKGKRYSDAAEAFRRVVSQFPGYSSADRAHFLMADSYSQGGLPGAAQLAHEQFIMFFPESELYSTVRFRLGSLRFIDNDYMRAAVDFTSVLSKPDVSEETASASLYNLALCQRMLGQDIEAQALLERYRQEHPSGDDRKADIGYQLGDIHDKAGRTQLAVEEFSNALAEKPRKDLAIEINYRIGACLEQLSNDEQAIHAYRKAMAATEKNHAFRLSALVRCAGLYEKMGSYDKALSVYHDLIRHSTDPELVVAAKERVSEIESNGK